MLILWIFWFIHLESTLRVVAEVERLSMLLGTLLATVEYEPNDASDGHEKEDDAHRSDDLADAESRRVVGFRGASDAVRGRGRGFCGRSRGDRGDRGRSGGVGSGSGKSFAWGGVRDGCDPCLFIGD